MFDWSIHVIEQPILIWILHMHLILFHLLSFINSLSLHMQTNQKAMSFNNQSKVQEGHKEDRVANKGPFNN